MSDPGPQPESKPPAFGALDSENVDEHARRLLELRIYRHRVMIGVALGCSVLFLGGLRLTGTDLNNFLPTGSRVFSEKSHVCLKTQTVPAPDGGEQFKVCTEWIDLTDTTGQIHTMKLEDLQIRPKPNGGYQANLKRAINYRLIVLVAFLGVIIFTGMRVQRVLINRFKRRLGIDSTA